MPPFHAREPQPDSDVSLVEFLGGPLDGFRYIAPYASDNVADIVILPINQNVVRMLQGKRSTRKRPATSAAVYALAEKKDSLRFRYLGATWAEKFNLETWKG